LARVAAQGPLSFRDVMETALYHPRHGYYSRLGGFGGEGDFVTSPELHPAFGVLLARQALDVWEALGRPRPLRIVELGGGSGALARAVLDQVASESSARVAYTLVERSRSLAARQRARLEGHDVAWAEAAAGAHLVLANEVLDALPVHRVVVRGGALRELRVGARAGRLVWVEAESAPAEVERYFEALGLLPPEGGVAEVNVALPAWAERVAAMLDRGLVLVLDYGGPAEALFGRPQGTLLTYYRHTLGSDPLVRLGRQDISAQVDFTTFATALRRAGLAVLGLVSQAALLGNLGLDQLRRALPRPADRHALARLADPRGLGRVRALFAARGLDGWTPAGLSGARAWPLPRHLPALPPEPAPADFLDQWREAFGEAAPGPDR
jgi:SAM-dependent MidA family methyltransferase